MVLVFNMLHNVHTVPVHLALAYCALCMCTVAALSLSLSIYIYIYITLMCPPTHTRARAPDTHLAPTRLHTTHTHTTHCHCYCYCYSNSKYTYMYMVKVSKQTEHFDCVLHGHCYTGSKVFLLRDGDRRQESPGRQKASQASLSTSTSHLYPNHIPAFMLAHSENVSFSTSPSCPPLLIVM